MKLNSLQISNFLGARAVDLTLTKPITLLAGKNYAGKSSVQEAVRMALTGEPVRVSLKKDYAALISEGHESGFVEVLGTDEGQDFTASIVLPSGKGKHSTDSTLNYVLDAQRFARLPDNERRQFLFGLMSVKLDGPAVKKRLLDKGCVESKVEQILPILCAGFDAANKEAGNKARDSKASYKTATGGDTWGKEKGGKWQPAALPEGAEHAADDLELAKKRLAEISADLSTAQQTLGAAKASNQQQREAIAKRAGIEAIAANLERYTTKFNLDTAELAAWEQKVADCKARAGVVAANPKAPGEFLLRGLANVANEFLALTCEYDEVQWPAELINRAAIHVNEYRNLHGDPVGHDAPPDQEAIANLPEYEKALRLMQSAVDHSKRDLEAAKITVEQLKVLDGMTQSANDIEGIQAKVNEGNAKRTAAQAEVESLRDVADKYGRRQTLIEQVKKLHADVLDWTAIADALAPDGIPAELLAEALTPINSRLAVNAGSAQWAIVTVHDDMRITYGLRDYELISESEKWRADAMIAEAVSHISGVKLLVLDRFDCLDAQGREDALYWLDDLAEAGEIDSCLLFGTLKSIPAQLLPNIEGFWIESGVAGAIKEAA